MKQKVATPEGYLTALPADREAPFKKLRATILAALPAGFSEQMSYGMISYVVPHSIYPAGYHAKPSAPLPFLSIANQKNFIGFYHMGIYADDVLKEWFVSSYGKHSKRKLDMGKSCVRFKSMDDIPFDLIGELCEKITVDRWVATYELKYKKG